MELERHSPMRLTPEDVSLIYPRFRAILTSGLKIPPLNNNHNDVNSNLRAPQALDHSINTTKPTAFFTYHTAVQTMADQLSTQPPPTPTYLLSYPAPHVLLITINRAKRMNSLPYDSHWEADTLIQWFDSEPGLVVAVVTGAGGRAFCAGQDLIEQGEIQKERALASSSPSGKWKKQMMTHPPSGFMGISRRAGKKPIIAAVNGFALGGGFEIVLGWYVLFILYCLLAPA